MTDPIIPITLKEKCSILSLKRIGKFHSNNYIEGLDSSNISNINFKDMNINTKPEICSAINNLAYENCALIFNNPYMNKEYENKKYFCTINSESKISDIGSYKFKYDINSNFIRPVSDIYSQNIKISYCEERWHDWFTIPNYHLGNGWYNYKDDNTENTTKCVGKCFMPCNLGYLPNETSNCILKKNYNNGIYYNDFDYTPLALICLLGTTYEEFQNKNVGYVNYLEERGEDIKNDKNIELLEKNGSNILDDIITKMNNENNVIWTDIKNDISKYINDIFINIPDIDDNFIKNNIMIPDEEIQQNLNFTNKQILYAYNIALKIQNYQREENKENYLDYRYKLKTISNLHEDKFKILLKILKKCCNLCFDNKSSFSSYYLFSLNKEGQKYESIQLNIEYDIADDEYKFFDFQKVKMSDIFNNNQSVYEILDSYVYYYFIAIYILILAFLVYIIVLYQYSFFVFLLNAIIQFSTFLFYYIYIYVGNIFSKKKREQIEKEREMKMMKFFEYFLKKNLMYLRSVSNRSND